MKNLHSFGSLRIRMDQHQLITRKTFLRFATIFMTAALIAIWNKMTNRNGELLVKPVAERIDVAKFGTGIFLFESFIVVKSSESLKIFSNKCTHAGCRINKEIDGKLVCPCHGSQFEAATGKVLQGPAGLPLSAIPFSTDIKTGEIIIKI
jgi:Rieske Fe-S protein